MRKSEYTDDDKHRIIAEIEFSEESIVKACDRKGISIATYYKWKKETGSKLNKTKMSSEQNSDQVYLVEENSTLRKLYINLSAHNYELAQFLDKH